MGVMTHLLSGIQIAAIAIVVSAGAAFAQQEYAGPEIGPITKLPLPRFVSLRASEANVRRGPSLSHRIDWVFQRRDMPLKIIAEYDHWRRVVDRDGEGGWVHYRMLSGARTVIIDAEMVNLHARPTPTSVENAQLETGVVAQLGDCNLDWCHLTSGGYSGWTQKQNLWGVSRTEIRD